MDSKWHIQSMDKVGDASFAFIQLGAGFHDFYAT
jgi:hypothetical protein